MYHQSRPSSSKTCFGQRGHGGTYLLPQPWGNRGKEGLLKIQGHSVIYTVSSRRVRDVQWNFCFKQAETVTSIGVPIGPPGSCLRGSHLMSYLYCSQSCFRAALNFAGPKIQLLRVETFWVGWHVPLILYSRCRSWQTFVTSRPTWST